jgi:hypothetical protein
LALAANIPCNVDVSEILAKKSIISFHLLIAVSASLESVAVTDETQLEAVVHAVFYADVT